MRAIHAELTPLPLDHVKGDIQFDRPLDDSHLNSARSPHSLELDRTRVQAGKTTVEDDDPLIRAAVAALVMRFEHGARETCSASGPASFPRRIIGVHGFLGIPSCPLRRASRIGLLPAVPTLLYVLGDPLAAELHRLHGCSQQVCVFVPDEAGGRFEPLPLSSRLQSAGLTPREADVTALLLARRTNAEIAQTLVVSEATVRAHCRSILRKLGVADRRALWDSFPAAGWHW